MAEMRYCSKCRKTMADTNFYQYKDGTKCELCKSCLTMHINVYDEESFLWIIQKFDVPYVPAEWKKTREKEFEKAYSKASISGSSDPKNAAYNMTKGNGVVFGKYLSKMKIKQWMNFSWDDTERLQKEAEEKAKLYGTPDEAMKEKLDEMKLAYANGEISEAQYMTYMDFNPAEEEEKKSLESEFLSGGGPETATPTSSFYPVNENPFVQVDLPDVGNDLTEEDKVYLAMKWGRLYSAADWVYLEQKYKDFMKSFDIQGAARIDTLIQICKLSLKMNQALDTGDIDSYTKLARAYDALMKAAKFTEAQRKEEKSGEFDAVGQVVFFAEKYKGKIPRHDIATSYDVIDEKIDNLKRYVKELVMNDTSLAQMIENYIKRREAMENQKQDLKEAKEKGLDYVEIKDEDYKEFYESIEQDKEEDAEDES